MRRASIWILLACLFSVTLCAPGFCVGRKWALLVGVSNYENSDLSSVPYAAADINSVSAVLRGYAGYSRNNVFVMTSDIKSGPNRPTNLNVFKRLDALARLIKPDDTLLVYFSCHGFNRDGRHYLATVNTDPSSTETLELSSVPLEMLSAKMVKLEAKQLIFICDACRNDPVRGKGDIDNIRTSDFSKGIMLAARASGGNVGGAAVLFACSEGERAYEWHDKQHGVFTYYLLEALRGAGAEPDGELTVTSLASYVQEHVSRWAAERSKNQTPDLRLQGSAKMVMAKFRPKPKPRLATAGSAVKLRSTVATLRVKTNPPGAGIYINGKQQVCGVTPCEIKVDLELAKSRQVEVGTRLAGHKTVLAEVTLERGKTTSLNLALKKFVAAGRSLVTIEPKLPKAVVKPPKPAVVKPAPPAPKLPPAIPSTTRLAMASPNLPVSAPLVTSTAYQLSTCYPAHTSTVTSIDFSPDCRTLASACWGGSIILRDIRSGKQLRTLFDRGHTVSGLSFSPDGSLLTTAGSDGTMNIWRVADGSLLTTCKGHAGPVTSVRFSPDSSLLATGGLDTTVRLWDVSSGRCTRLLNSHNRAVLSVDFSPDGSIVASADDEGVVRLWNTDNGVQRKSAIRHPQSIACVRFGPDGKTLATGGFDCTVRIWDPTTSRLVRTLKTGEAWIFDLCFSPDGSRLMAAAGDRTIRTWETTSGNELSPLVQEIAVKSVAVSPDGTTLATGGVDGSLTIWRGN